MKTGAIVVVVLLSLTAGFAQSYSVQKYTVGGGAGWVQSNQLQSAVNAGEAIAGKSSSVAQELAAGILFSHRAIRVLHPNGGEIWTPNTTATIQWGTIGEIANVAIWISTTAGASWEQITTATANDGEYQWVVTALPSTTALVRIADATDSRIRDESDAAFSIVPASIQITAPSSGTIWNSGSAATVQWSWTGSIAAVDIAYRSVPSASWQVVTSGIVNAGTYVWQVPDEPSTQAQLRVTASGSAVVEDISEPFEIRSTTQTAFALALWLEGAYDGTTQSMHTLLENSGYLPTNQPYGSMGYNGTEQKAGWIDQVTDWVLLQFRSGASASSVVGQTAALVLSNGRVIDESGYPQVLVSSASAPAGQYYVVVRHRNHIAMMSSTAVVGSIGYSNQEWDFRDGVMQAYRQFADGQKQVGTQAVMIGGDVYQDGIINARDRVQVRNHLFQTGYVTADATLDGVVNAEDRTLVRNNTFSVTQVP